MDYISRKEWGARPPKRPLTPLRASRVRGVVIHHTGVKNALGGLSAVLSAERHHIDTRGWNAIAYNWLVDASTGRIFEGRGMEYVGGATKGWNSRSVSVCMIGWGDDQPSDMALASIRLLVQKVQDRYGDGWVKTHRMFKSTRCPGEWLGNWVENGMDSTPSIVSPSLMDQIKMYIDALYEQVKSKPLSRWRRSKGEAVREVQKKLLEKGFNCGTADGVFGRRTQSAVKAFQRTQGFLKADGVVGRNTFHAMFYR